MKSGKAKAPATHVIGTDGDGTNPRLIEMTEIKSLKITFDNAAVSVTATLDNGTEHLIGHPNPLESFVTVSSRGDVAHHEPLKTLESFVTVSNDGAITRYEMKRASKSMGETVRETLQNLANTLPLGAIVLLSQPGKPAP